MVVGNGSVEQAAAFHYDKRLPFALYTDPSRRSYAAAGLKHGVATAFSPKVALHALRAMRAGHGQGRAQGDVWQQGGTFVIRPDHTVVFAQVSNEAGDHADPAKVLAALEAAR